MLFKDLIAPMFGGVAKPLFCRDAGRSIAVLVLTFPPPAEHPPAATNPDILFLGV